MWQFWIQVFPIVVFLILALFVGSWVERRHFRRLDRREAALKYMLVTDLRTLPPGCESQPCELVIGEVVSGQ